MKYVDLTQTFTATMPVFPGDSAPELTQIADFICDGYAEYQLKSGMHVGTHLATLLGADRFEVFAWPLKLEAEAALARVIAKI